MESAGAGARGRTGRREDGQAAAKRGRTGRTEDGQAAAVAVRWPCGGWAFLILRAGLSDGKHYENSRH